MRSSKSRSRSKANRPRTLGNIINRVFDSSGPEGKVRGTPQQIIEKYLFLGRDAQLSNDRVAAENFLQHAEHYTRLLAEAQRELQAEQDARQQAHGGQPNGGGQRGDRQQGRDDREPRGDRGDWRGEQPRGDFRDDRGSDLPSGIEIVETEDDTGLVETPEMRQEPAPSPETAPAADAASGKADRGNRRPRGPRRPKGDHAPDGQGGEGGGGAGGDGPSAEAAE